MGSCSRGIRALGVNSRGLIPQASSSATAPLSSIAQYDRFSLPLQACAPIGIFKDVLPVGDVRTRLNSRSGPIGAPNSSRGYAAAPLSVEPSEKEKE
eukprot:7330631-Pyramimonas_sp.AAC.1